MKIRGMKSRMITGLAWSGTYDEAAEGEIKKLIEQVKKMENNIEDKINAHELVSVTIHDRRDGFTHYTGWETEGEKPCPEGMARFLLPEGDYLIYRHIQEDDIHDTYTKIVQEIEKRGLTPLKMEDNESFDDLPIKIEMHSAEKILEGEPEFEVHIPVAK